MAYDGESDRIVLFGGWFAFESGPKDDTWTYDYNTNTWTDMNPGTRPSPRGTHAMAYDAESDRVILFGGEIPETWAYDYDANTWTNMTPGTSPSPRIVPGMAYDAESDRIVLFGGCICPGTANLLGDTWSYDFNANSWVEMNPQEAPPREDAHGMAYDARADRIIFWGGVHSSRETWAYDFDRDTWALTASGMGPSLRSAPRLAYDTESERIVLFGGLLGLSLPNLVPNDETWALVPPPTDFLLFYIVIGVVAAAVVVVLAIFLTRRRSRMRKGEGGE